MDGDAGIPSNRKEGGEEPMMKLIQWAIKILHIVAVAGTYAAFVELLLTALVWWLSH